MDRSLESRRVVTTTLATIACVVSSVLSVAPSLVMAAPLVVCDAINASSNMPAVSALPDAAMCLRKANVAQDLRSKIQAADALFADAKQQMHNARFEEAGKTLDCAEAVLVSDSRWKSHYDLIRLRGNLAYLQERVTEALPRYECALQLARNAGNAQATAVALNNIGTAWTRLGDYPQALHALSESRDLQLASGGEAFGKTLMNLADAHRDVGDPEMASRFYQEAYHTFEKDSQFSDMGHVREAMSLLAFDRGDNVQANERLQQSLTLFRQAGEASRPYLLRTYAGLIRSALAREQLADARVWAAAGLDVAQQYRLTPPPEFVLQAAQVERLSGHIDAAQQRLSAAIDRLPATDPDRIALLQALSEAQQAEGDHAAALQSLLRVQQAGHALEKERLSKQLIALKFHIARDRAVVELEARDRQQTRFLWCVIGASLLVILTIIAVFLRRQWCAGLMQAARQARHEQELAHYSQLADELRFDRNVLQASLDSREDALCILDANAHVLASNGAACAVLSATAVQMIGTAFIDYLPSNAHDVFLAAFERLEDLNMQHFSFKRDEESIQCDVQLSEWQPGDGVVLLRLQSSATHTSEQPIALQQPLDIQQNEAVSPAFTPELREEFRRALVELMLASVQAWERSTGLNRLEMAERSRIWRVSIDDGRLRARTMERYLVLAKLPQHPHWRDVLRSAYFVLGQCTLDDAARSDLQARVDAALIFTRRSALV